MPTIYVHTLLDWIGGSSDRLIGANWSTGQLGDWASQLSILGGGFGHWLCLANCVAAARFMWPDQVANVCRCHGREGKGSS